MRAEALKSAESVPKRAVQPARFRRRMIGYRNARTALQAYLAAAGLRRGDPILLPAYIGWSPNEGSGVFDPVSALELRPIFYAVDGELNLDLADFAAKAAMYGPKAVLLIHYFGRVDPSAAQAATIARVHGALVVEDAAHALFTMLVGGAAGHLGDATILSLHKMLPVNAGGALVLPDDSAFPGSLWPAIDLLEYDLAGIAAQRLSNASLATRLLRPLVGQVDLLWRAWPPGHVPQTLPVIIRNRDRYAVYRRMNERGLGVVSLYHTLIPQISRAEYSSSFEISDRILNLPIHQDVAPESLAPMIENLGEIVNT